jgi:membrane protein implicated in regulation of membrane protease activity
MKHWKRKLAFSAFGAGAVLLLTGKRAAGLAFTAAGFAALAAAYPDKFQEVWDRAPEYIDRGTRMVNDITKVAERLAEQGAHWGARRAKQASEYLT